MCRKRISYRCFRINSWVDINRNYSGGEDGEATIAKNHFENGFANAHGDGLIFISKHRPLPILLL